jgi:hypothetical protein
MFGLFKKQPSFNSPEEKLKHEMQKKIENMALLVFSESPMKGTPMEGMALMSGITEAKKFYSKRSVAISQDYGVSRENTISIIDNCAKSVYNEFIEN